MKLPHADIEPALNYRAAQLYFDVISVLVIEKRLQEVQTAAIADLRQMLRLWRSFLMVLDLEGLIAVFAGQVSYEYTVASIFHT